MFDSGASPPPHCPRPWFDIVVSLSWSVNARVALLLTARSETVLRFASDKRREEDLTDFTLQTVRRVAPQDHNVEIILRP